MSVLRITCGTGDTFMKLQEALNQIWHTPKRHAVISAPGGAGKSFLVKDLACHTDGPLPIYIDLSAAGGEHYIFSEILREYFGNTNEHDDVSAGKAVLHLFNSESNAFPAYRLILDGIDDADKSANPGLHTEINELSKCTSLQIVITVRSLDFLKTNYYFDRLSSYSHISLRLLSEEKRDSILSEAGLSPSDMAPSFLDILRRPMFLSVFLDLASEGKANYSDQLTSARDLFSAIVSRDIEKQAGQDGLYDKAEYAFHYLLPCLANVLNRVSFTSEELKQALYKAYLDTSYKCGAFDGISTDLIARAKQHYADSEFPEFRRFVAEEVFQKYASKIFIPRGYIVKTGTSSFRFSHRNWLQYFQMEHMFNLMQRYDEDPSLSEIPSLLAAQLGQKERNASYDRQELSKLILSAWENATDDSDKTPRERPRRTLTPSSVVLSLAAILLLAVALLFFNSKSHKGTENETEPAPISAEEKAPEPSSDSPVDPDAEESVDTLDFVLTPTEMTVAEFTAASETIHERLETLVDGKALGFYEEDNALHIRLPKEALHDIDPYRFMKSYISRPIELFMVDLESWSVSKPGYYDSIAVSRSDIESVEILHGSIPGVDPVEYGFDETEYPYIKVILTSQFAEICSGKMGESQNVVFAQDVLEFDPWYYYTTFPQSDGRTFFLLDTSFRENIVKTVLYNFTHEPLANAFSITHNPPIDWENPETAIRSGRNQVTIAELDENAVIIEYSSPETDTITGRWLDTNLALKNRLDTLDQPYAVGSYSKNDQYSILIKTDLSKLTPLMPDLAYILAVSSFSEDGFMIHGLESYATLADSVSTLTSAVVSDDNGLYSLRIYQKANSNKMTFAEYAEQVCTENDRDLYLNIARLPLLSATPEDIADAYSIEFRHLYGRPDEGISGNDKWILDLASEIVSGKSLPLQLKLSRIFFDSGDPLVPDSGRSIYVSDQDKIIKAVSESAPSATVSFPGPDEIHVNLNIYVDEDLPLTAINQIKDIYSATDFENSRFTHLNFFMIEENVKDKEQARLFISKYRYWGNPGYIEYSSYFLNGRLNKYKDRYNSALNDDPFFSCLRRNPYDVY